MILNSFNIRSLALYSGLVILIIISFAPQTDLMYKGFLASISEGLVINLANPHRQNLSLPPLQRDDLLSKAAQMKADDMEKM